MLSELGSNFAPAQAYVGGVHVIYGCKTTTLFSRIDRRYYCKVESTKTINTEVECLVLQCNKSDNFKSPCYCGTIPS